MKPAVVRFYFDADLLGLAHVICRIRPDCTFPGDPGARIQGRERGPCVVTDPGSLDPEWIPLVSERGWVIVTRDRHIARRPLERASVRDNKARLIAISGREGTSKWNQLEIFMRQWRSIDALTARPGPFIVAATRSRLAQVDLA
ncbi:hypothetical protein [Pseudactinotalea sp. HY160]|uniref:PIN-like domain-containing protein n=1 Tax=Pseudactinotalea sp. HY160 TaxID=2654490 RepID=UPI001883A618